MARRISDDEAAAHIILRRRGHSIPKACDEMERMGFPPRSASSWSNWERYNGLELKQHGDARRYVVYLGDRPICWGSPSWCASCLGIGVAAMHEHMSGRDCGFPVRRVLMAPCELMDGCAGGDVRMVQRLVRAAHSSRRSKAKRRCGADGGA